MCYNSPSKYLVLQVIRNSSDLSSFRAIWWHTLWHSLRNICRQVEKVLIYRACRSGGIGRRNGLKSQDIEKHQIVEKCKYSGFIPLYCTFSDTIWLTVLNQLNVLNVLKWTGMWHKMWHTFQIYNFIVNHIKQPYRSLNNLTPEEFSLELEPIKPEAHASAWQTK